MSTIAPTRPAETPAPEPAPEREPERRASVGAWPIASRLARREVQRRPGRTVLVMLLVVLPVFFMTVGSVLVRADMSAGGFIGSVFESENSISASPGFEEISGAVDEDGAIMFGGVVGAREGEPAVQRDPFTAGQLDELRDVVGDRGEVLDVTSVFSDIASPVTSEFVRLAEWPAGVSDIVVEDSLAFDAGRAPVAANEVLLSRRIADAFDVNVGDELVLTSPQRSWEVVGIARNRGFYSHSFAYVGSLDRSDIVADQLNSRLLVLPSGEPGGDELELLGSQVTSTLDTAVVNVNRPEWFVRDAGEEARALAWGWVGGVVALIAVGVVISAAFATSARRQLATVGQLSANGAPAKVIERSLALQGSWTGVLGSALGVGLGLVAVLSGWWLFEELVGYDLPVRTIAVFDLAVIAATATVAATLAALFPAKSAARVPVLTALAGRRPVGEIPRWLAPVGMLASAAGLGLLALVAVASRTASGGDLAAFVAVVGSVFIMIGLLCISPVLLEIAGRIGHSWPGSILLAVRSLVRQRTRSSAVVSSIAVVMALTTAGLTGLGIVQGEAEAATVENRTIKTVRSGGLDGLAGPPPQSLIDQIDEIAPNAERLEVQSVRLTHDPVASRDFFPEAVVASDEVLPLLGLGDVDIDRLSASGIGTGYWADGFGGPEFGLEVGDGNPAFLEVDNSSVVWFDFVVTPEWVGLQGLEPFTSEVLFVNDEILSADQVQQANRFVGGGVDSAFVSVREGRSGSASSTGGQSLEAMQWSVFSTANSSVGFPWNLVKLAALAASLLLVSGVVAIGLGLAAVESRDERSVLHVVGAPPAVLRRVAAAKTWVLTTLAAVVAVPTGFVAVWVIRAASKEQLGSHAGVPWLAVVSLVLVVPALAAVASWIGSAIASRVRPVTASRMRLD